MIDLHLSKKLFNESFYPLLFSYESRWEVYMGSAGSGKSYHIAQKLIIRACNEKIRILVCRRYATTIRQTVFNLIKEVLKKWKIIQYIKVNESDYRITFPNGSEIIFMGLDEETKLLSLNDIGTIWVEETYECNKSIIDQLNLRMRGNNENQQIILSFNPISKNHWLFEFVNNPPESYIFHHSTYKDNKFLNKDYIASLEELRIRNPQKARIYCDGKWGIDVDGLIFTNWRAEEFDEYELGKKLEHRVGSDLGFIDPTTIICSLYDRDNKTIYVYDEFYASGYQLDEVYAEMIRMNLGKSTIYMDSAEPRTIEYFKRQGINAKPCIKGQNSVDARIKFLQNHLIIVKPKCEKLIMELENFSYEKDKRTDKFIEDKYTHEYSHAIDALGYSYSNLYSQQKLKTLDKSILGL